MRRESDSVDVDSEGERQSTASAARLLHDRVRLVGARANGTGEEIRRVANLVREALIKQFP